MYISRVLIRNFRDFRLLDISLKPGVTCLVGENNTGKTNFFHALRYPLRAKTLVEGIGYLTSRNLMLLNRSLTLLGNL
jgi:predicted ATP-dependent endonuclease of OLD family